MNKKEGNLILAVFIGFILDVILGSFAVLGDLIAGFVAGYIAGGDWVRGSMAGFIAGIFGGLLLGLIIFLFSSFFSLIIGPLAFLFSVLGLIPIFFGIKGAIIMAIGGAIGALVKSR
ncbi:MAG: DUF5518 domain-containing protein [Thermoproteales archaeon]|nr:DUF5518 domain-containing protein [Thermoproteales archaeon]